MPHIEVSVSHSNSERGCMFQPKLSSTAFVETLTKTYVRYWLHFYDALSTQNNLTCFNFREILPIFARDAIKIK